MNNEKNCESDQGPMELGSALTGVRVLFRSPEVG